MIAFQLSKRRYLIGCINGEVLTVRRSPPDRCGEGRLSAPNSSDRDGQTKFELRCAGFFRSDGPRLTDAEKED